MREKETPVSLHLCHITGDNDIKYKLFALHYCKIKKKKKSQFLPICGSTVNFLEYTKPTSGFCLKTQEKSEVAYMLLPFSILEKFSA